MNSLIVFALKRYLKEIDELEDRNEKLRIRLKRWIRSIAQQHLTIKMIKLESNTSCTLKKLSILIDKELHKEIKKKALAQDTTLTDLITTMITTYLKENS